jgi:hypothetical protein
MEVVVKKLSEALEAALQLMRTEKRPVFLLTADRKFRISPSEQHPGGFEIWTSSLREDAWKPWHISFFDVEDIMSDAWCVQSDAPKSEGPTLKTAVPLAIQLHVVRPDGHHYDFDLVGQSVLPTMWEAVEDLVHALTTGERLLPKDLYDLCALAFDVPRDEAKRRILASSYGMSYAQIKRATEPEPHLIGWTWKAHLTQLHDDVRAGRWIHVSKTLSLMLGHAVDKLLKASPESPA